MSMSMSRIWKEIPCCQQELNLKVVLSCGQSFRWNPSLEDPETLVGVLDNKLWLLKQSECGAIQYQTLVEEEEENTGKVGDTEEESFLRSYFQLDVNVSNIYKTWSKNDLFFKDLQTRFYGIRILRQDPVENLFSFICSQNNNIVRIAQLVEKLCVNYGQFVATYEDKKYYSFPTVVSLSKSTVEQELRSLGFGYRAKFIQKAAETICNKPDGEDWLLALRDQSYEDAHSSLCSLYGVGPKVADCVCLMSLDKHSAIPVDTHMWQIAAREYLPHLKKLKNITDKAYNEIGNFFREQFGEYAGWAQSVLFCSDLKKFEDLKGEAKKSVKMNREKRKNDSGQKKTKLKKKRK